MSGMTITEFLLARIMEDEAVARDAHYDGQRWVPEEEAVVAADRDLDPILYLDRKRDAYHAANWSPARVLAECEAKRRIVEFHKSWPVLVDSEPTFEADESYDPSRMAFRMSKQIAWTTEQQYREHFGTEPPSSPIIRALASVYSEHPDYESWVPDDTPDPNDA